MGLVGPNHAVDSYSFETCLVHLLRYVLFGDELTLFIRAVESMFIGWLNYLYLLAAGRISRF